ncbi:MAG: NAD(P)-dependent oxidoreductase [Chloroflexi bacterium]|nr:NAD(P)-dependent oxidoreductase [Chloroflexota bacterium]
MAYLVTGGTGFIGSYVVRDLLEAGKKVVCLQRSGITPLFRNVVGEQNIDRVKIFQGDVSDPLQVFDVIRKGNVEVIVHLSYVLPPMSDLQPAYALRVNCVGLNNVLEAVRLFGLKRLVWTSSSRAMGRLKEVWDEPVGGDDALYMPDDFYGATKVLGEFMLKLYFDKYGTDSIGIRTARTFGTGKTTGTGTTLYQFFRNAALGIPATIGGANKVSAYQYVEDLSHLLVCACEVPTPKSRIFATGEELTTRQLVEIIRRINPQAQVTVEERADAGMVVIPASASAIKDSSRVTVGLGWQPKYTVENGLRKLFNYFRQQEGMPPL